MKYLLKLVSIILGIGLVFFLFCYMYMVWTPSAIPVSISESELQSLKENLQKDVKQLSNMGPRNAAHLENLKKALNFLEVELSKAGYEIKLINAFVGMDKDMHVVQVENMPSGTSTDVIIAARFSSLDNSPGANYNASGVAALLELAKLMKNQKTNKTIKFIFVPENMETYLHDMLVDGLNFQSFISLESLGYYNPDQDQKYGSSLFNFLPFVFPKKANFLAVTSSTGARWLVRTLLPYLRGSMNFPVIGYTFPFKFLEPKDSLVDPFRFKNYMAATITDTSELRDKDYGLVSDTPERLNYEAISRTVLGLQNFLVNSP